MSVNSVLLLVDIQSGLTTANNATWGPVRSNPSFESNTAQILAKYRTLANASSSCKVIHIQHSSTTPDSPLHPSKPGFKFQAFAQPTENELIITKSVNSAFIGTNLEAVLREHFSERAGTLYVVGLTTDHCVSTTVRMAGNLGVANGSSEGEKGQIVLIGDATACWQKWASGKDAESGFAAELVHAVHLESLKEFATVETTREILSTW